MWSSMPWRLPWLPASRFPPQTRSGSSEASPPARPQMPVNAAYRWAGNGTLAALPHRNQSLTAKVSVLHSQRTSDTNPPILTIELIGSYIARHVETGLTVDLTSSRNRSRTKGPISPLCRKLIDLSHDPETRVHVTREALDRDRHIAVFKRDRSLRAWAATDCVETEKTSVYVVKYQPFPRHLFPRR